MAVHVLTDPKLWVDKYDLSGDHSGVSLLYGTEPQDITTFGQTTRRRTGGMKTVALTQEGLWNGGTDALDEILFNRVGLADVPVSLALEGGDEGEAAYLFRSLRTQYTPGAQVGEMLRFQSISEAASGEGLARGIILHNAAKTATGTGTKFDIGIPVAAGQQLRAALHVLAASGTTPTLDVIVQSDANSSAGGETNRITFAQATGKTSEFKTLAGTITDQFWRVSYTIGGTGPSFTFVVTIGIA